MFGSLKKHLRIFWEDFREFSLSYAVADFMQKVTLIRGEIRQNQYEKATLKYLQKNFSSCFETTSSTQTAEQTPSRYVWVMWWQGERQMPAIVKRCYERLKQNLPADRELVLLTRSNYTDWVSLPSYIEDRLASGAITVTHLSDIIRFRLLEKFGGFWIDATVLTIPIPRSFFDRDFFSLHAPGLFPVFISRGNWSPFLIYCRYPGYALPKRMTNFFSIYWKRHNRIIDYLLIDYGIYLILANDSSLRATVKALPVNREFYWLNAHLNEHVSDKEFQEHLAASCFHKLTYKKKRIQIDGQKTAWDHIMRETEEKRI